MSDGCKRCGGGKREKWVEVDTGHGGVENVGGDREYSGSDTHGYICESCAIEVIRFINGDEHNEANELIESWKPDRGKCEALPSDPDAWRRRLEKLEDAI